MIYSIQSISGTWMTNTTGFSAICRRKQNMGFTVMELLLAIAVLAILTTLAVPSFTQFIQNNRLAGQANEMVATFQFARSEALKRSLNVRACASDDNAGCSGAWTDGWIVIADEGGDDEELLRVWPAPADGFQITASSSYVGFEPTGASEDAVEQQFSLMLSGCTNDNARDVFVERTGRVASERVDCPE